MSKHQFQTEVNQLLNLIIHSLYSHKEIFLRELISNASDALDKLRYMTLTSEKMKKVKMDPRIDISFDDRNQTTLTISDTGIGMNDQDLVEHLGTIARSGTKNFLEKMTGDAKKDSNLIGKFGVGFYSIFMVSDKVEVISRKAGENKAYKWTSDGKSDYEIEDAEKEEHGTTVILYLKKDEKEFAGRFKIEEIVKKYSNHIPFPVTLHYTEVKSADEKGEKTEARSEQINSVTALWMRPKSELKEKDYNDFYRSITMDTEDPLMHIHTHAEGKLEYTTLLYIPKKAPYDLFFINYQPGVKLYIDRVFITDDEKELLPSYLRFIRGIIDSEDLPLNISRETLQQNRIMANIRSAATKKILSELQNLAKKKEKYTEFYDEFGKALKEGLYHDFPNRELLLDLVRFKSIQNKEYISLDEYKKKMKKGQKTVYYIAGDKEDNLRNSPLLEAYKKEDIDVLLMTDEIDQIVIPSIGTYKDIPIKSVNQSDAADDLKTEKDEKKEKAIDPLIKKIKEQLKDRVKDVKVSVRLNDSPSCVVADKNDPTIQMQQMMRAMGQKGMMDVKPILEINPDHSIIKKMKKITDDKLLSDISNLLFEQAIIAEGGEVKDRVLFAKRLNNVILKAIST
ncbi:MAG: molecular chaperone HtpG [Spirochaetes bacterium]|nr:molecular chaperone HtpG [Spirochaetota bacterium]